MSGPAFSKSCGGALSSAAALMPLANASASAGVNSRSDKPKRLPTNQPNSSDNCTSVKAGAVVVAAGAWSAPFARQLGDSIVFDTERGYHVEIASPQTMPSRPVMWAEGKLFATPMNGRLRGAGTVELAGLKAPPNWRRADLLLGQLHKMFPGAVAGAKPSQSVDGARWQGFRPSTPDSLPVVGAASKVPNAFYAFGHGHVGLTAAASTGRTIAALVSGERPDIDLSPFSIGRFR